MPWPCSDPVGLRENAGRLSKLMAAEPGSRSKPTAKVAPPRAATAAARLPQASPPAERTAQKRQRVSASARKTGGFDDDVPIAEQLDFLKKALEGASSGSPAAAAEGGGLLTRSHSATRLEVDQSSALKRKAEQAAEARFVKGAAPLVPPMQMRMSVAASKKQQLKSMDPSAAGRKPPAAAAHAAASGGGSAGKSRSGSASRHIAPPSSRGKPAAGRAAAASKVPKKADFF